MYSGADFYQTSTGKQQPAATPEAAYVMCEAIKEYDVRPETRSDSNRPEASIL